MLEGTPQPSGVRRTPSTGEIAEPRGYDSVRPPATPPSDRPPSRSFTPPSDRAWYERLPRPPGESAFHVKGLAYRGLLKYIETRLPGGTPAFTARLRDPLVCAYLSQPFMGATFYDLLPLVTASGVIAAMSGVSLENYAQIQGRAQALHDAGNTYRAFVKGRSFDDLPARFRMLTSRYYDFGEWGAYSIAPGVLRFFQRGLPAWCAPWFGPMQQGYIRGLVNAFGRTDASFTLRAPRRDGVRDGLPTVTLEIDVAAHGADSPQ
jgi:hypothetical protein